jgi:lipid-A-disaccharide synthase-like uncharacterized protein
VVVNLRNEPWVILLASAVLLFGVISGLRTGRAVFFFGAAKRSEDPMLFWTSVVLGGVLGTSGIVILVLKMI